MTCASRFFNYSKKFRHAHNVLRNGNAILMRWFTNDAKPSVDKVDKVSRFSQLGHGNERGISKFSSGGCFNISNGAVNPTKVSAMETVTGNALRTREMHPPAIGMVFIRRQQIPARSFSTDVDLLLPFRSSTVPRDWDAFSVAYNDRGKYCKVAEERG